MNMKDSWREENSSQQVKSKWQFDAIGVELQKNEVQHDSVKSDRKDFESL